MPPKTKSETFGNIVEKGMAILGSPEAKFNQSVKERIKTGKTEEEAQGECLADLARTLQAESISGSIEKKSKSFKEFQIALKSILSKKELKGCKEDSKPEHGLFSAPPGVSVDADDITSQRQYFEKKFKNYGGQYIPDGSMISRHALQTKNMEAILTRLASSGSIDVAHLKFGGNATSADVGKILSLKETMDHAESAHELRLGGGKIMRAMWESAKTDITKNIWGDIKNMFSSGFRLKPLELLMSSTKLAIDLTLLIPKMLAKGALNSLTLRPDRVN